jgi:hypothetical protein
MPDSMTVQGPVITPARHTTASLFEPNLKTGDVFDDPQFPIAWEAKH